MLGAMAEVWAYSWVLDSASCSRKGERMTTPVECVILDIPDGLRLDLLGLVVEVGRVFGSSPTGPACSADSWPH